MSRASSSAASATPFACERKDVAPGRKVGATGLPMDGPDGKNAADVLHDIRVTDPATGKQTAPLGELIDGGGPVLLHLVRRFGCPLCREAAADLSTMAGEVQAAGGRLVAIGCQTEGLEEFVEGSFFAGPVWVDADKLAFSALKLHRSGLHDGYGFLDPASWSAMWRSYQRGVPGDLKGDGFQMGGTFLFVGGRCVYDHRMTSHGDKPDVDEIEAALRTALTASKVTAGPAAAASGVAGSEAATAGDSPRA
ncbi:hypothetical protein FNF27_03419 [Cafeteria roenbergensis]|uniref:Alkyl hydroperoxide reductase subunit C/ Thiol specific antioxidant domain-containing protein n=1 Tax=Cafeteria roenbergensis TaxID=33653 RepID=A0A5A8E042_CAFRO|nr:hypothetical protein FNF28_02245 [Cafeteria roenbergensis]KAA0175121.1 hypothetical protein FNF27_03419 [Cafeteria roenbergensis]